MEKKWLLGIIGVFLGLSIIGLVSAHGFGQGINAQNTRNQNIMPGAFHETMENILKEGSFADLQAFREEHGFGGPHWVVDEETFQQWKERHELMEEQGMMPGYARGMSRNQRQGFGCPMMQ